jgi:RimJ/RimL family protein N-acetyltransferase
LARLPQPADILRGVTELRTERLLLRRWREADLAPLAALNADPQVMEHFSAPLTGAQSDALVARVERHFEQRGYGLWAVARHDDDALLGFTGLEPVGFDAPFTPVLEVGWRLARSAWGHGYATEAAHAALEHAFGALGVPEVVSLTAQTNRRSQRVMQRLGMTRDPADDFDHPGLPPGHPLRRHVLYRIAR